MKQPIAEQSPYYYDIKVNVQMQGKITRLISRNHAIEFETTQDEKSATVHLAGEDKTKVPN